MNIQKSNPHSPISPITAKRKNQRTNWHEAVSCAIQIELRDYTHMLEFQTEYILGKNSYRIDLLIIKKLTTQLIPKNIAIIFRSYNLFEIKGADSVLNTDSYYKTIGYAGLLISQTGKKNQYTASDITLTFTSFHYPRKLFNHLKKERNLIVEKSSQGIYYINKETFCTQIIVTTELSSEEYLYLHCLTDKLQDANLVGRLTEDFKRHQNQDIYVNYMHQLTTATLKAKGNTPMVCEGLLNLFGTSSEEIIERTKKEEADYYLPQISSLSSQVNYLKSLLEQNNIQFNLDSITNLKQK